MRRFGRYLRAALVGYLIGLPIAFVVLLLFGWYIQFRQATCTVGCEAMREGGPYVPSVGAVLIVHGAVIGYALLCEWSHQRSESEPGKGIRWTRGTRP